jgi:hypothetical protein
MQSDISITGLYHVIDVIFVEENPMIIHAWPYDTRPYQKLNWDPIGCSDIGGIIWSDWTEMRVNMILHFRFVSHLYMALNKLRELGKECMSLDHGTLSEWDCCSTPTHQFFSIYHGENKFSGSSRKQQSSSWHGILIQSQLVFTLSS